MPATRARRITLFPGDSEMARRMGELDWRATALGPTYGWTHSLRTAVRILLTSRHAMWMGWGPDLAFLYNDAYKPTLGVKHPAALGWPAQQVWSEIWNDISPRIETVMKTGTATWDESLLLVLERSGYMEETYHTFSYSPLTEDDGTVSGVLCVVTEETDRVIGERRLASLQELASSLASTTTELDTLPAIERVLARSSKDLSFTLTYLLKNAGTKARLAVRTGIPFDHSAAPQLIDIGMKDPVWPGDAVLQGNAPILVNNLGAQFADLPGGVWKKPPRQALLVPIVQQGQAQPAGFFVAGLNPFRRLDEGYSGFIQLIAGQVAASLANARAVQEERKLQEVSTRLVAANNGTSLLKEIVDAAIAITDADMGNIQLLDRAYGELKIVASQGFDSPFLEYFNTLQGGEPACGAAMERHERVIIEDVTTSPVFAGSPALDVVLAAGVRAVQCTPLVNRSGRIVGMLSTHYRTTRHPVDRDLGVLDLLARQAADWVERTQAEEARRDGEERFRRLFELGTIGRAITSPAKGCLEVNEEFCSILGYDRAELLQKGWPELTHSDDLAADVEQFNRVLAGEIDGYSMDKRWIRKDGTVVDTTVWVNCVRDEGGAVDYFVAQVQDITERKRAEEALRESEERYRSLISQVKDFAIFSTDERGIVTTWNEGCQVVLGYSQEEFIGLNTAQLFTAEDRAQGILAAELRQAREAGTTGTERWMIARGGRRFFAVGATAAFRDSVGRVMGFSWVVRDLTSMKEFQDQLTQRGESLERLVSERTGELEETTERLRVSERMAALGTLAAGLGHDMGNLLLPMDVRLGLLIEADLPRELHEHVVGIQKCARYLQRLSSGLRLLATNPAHVESRGATDLDRWWKDVHIILKDVLPGGIRFEHHLPEAESWVALGRTGLTQVVYNLVQNAADAIKEHGGSRVSVSVENDPPAPWITIRVADDGPGMTDEVARHCMEPYFSTKSRGESTGMGLSLVHALVTDAGGQVEIQSAPGQGTTISLILPRALPKEPTPDTSADMIGAV